MPIDAVMPILDNRSVRILLCSMILPSASVLRSRLDHIGKINIVKTKNLLLNLDLNIL